jgi:hypothetical protein
MVLVNAAEGAADLDVAGAGDGELLDAAERLARVVSLVAVAQARVLAGVCNPPRVADRLAELQPEVIALAGTPLADGTVRTLLCDPDDLHAIIVDSLGVPLDHGRRVRLATPAQRRALIVRDGGCAFPGCTTPPQWCDAHHIDPYAAGGRTDLNRLVLLCRHHHGVTHRRGWSMTTTPDDWPQWTTPTGRTITSQRHGRRRPQAEPGQPRAA